MPKPPAEAFRGALEQHRNSIESRYLDQTLNGGLNMSNAHRDVPPVEDMLHLAVATHGIPYEVRESKLAIRDYRHPADVAGWAAAGHLNVVTGIPPVLCGAETVAGMVQVPMAEFMGLFRRIGPSDEHARLKRVMSFGATAWLTITDPAEGLLVRSFDLLVDAGNLHQFEDERDLLPRLVSTIGATPRYDWDAMYAWLFWFAHEKGLPETKTALVSLVQDWFVQNSKSGEVPDESTIRKRLTSLWSKLRGEEPI